MRRTDPHSRQRGAALIIGLILLAIITLLAVVGMNIANSELASATSEQIRLRAFQTAEAGLEHGIVDMKFVGTSGPALTGVKSIPAPVAGSPKDVDGNPIDKYTTTITFHGTGAAPGYSLKDFAAFYYTVESQGASSRNAVANHALGAYLVNNTGTKDFQQLPVATP
jgi:hypothetical protein